MQCELVFRLPAGENCDEWNVACAGCYEASLEKPDENRIAWLLLGHSGCYGAGIEKKLPELLNLPVVDQGT